MTTDVMIAFQKMEYKIKELERDINKLDEQVTRVLNLTDKPKKTSKRKDTTTSGTTWDTAETTTSGTTWTQTDTTTHPTETST